MGADAKRSGAGQANTRTRDADAHSGKAAPHAKSRKRAKDDEEDMPMREQVRGRRLRGRATLRQVAVRRGERPSARFSSRITVRDIVDAGPSMSLRGTHDVLVHQNVMADSEGLERIQSDMDLERMRNERQLVDFSESSSLRVNPELPYDRRCARPWTVRFAEDLARDFHEQFGVPLQVNSAARSVEYQLHLAHFNGNAAGVEGETSSPHLTGQAIDIGKRGMSRAQLGWMRSRLMPLMQAGKIDVEEEFKQACFHISVYRNYMPPVHEFAATPITVVPINPVVTAQP